MKTRNVFGLGAVVLISLLFFSSCQQEDSDPVLQAEESEQTAQEVDLTAMLEDIDDIAVAGFQRNGFTDRTMDMLEEDLCEKVMIQWLPELKKMIIDFGDGCTSPRGVTRKGKMIVSYTGRYWVKGTKITTTFENFYLNERKIEGIRVVTNEGYNENDKFFSFQTVIEDGNITWPDGTFRTFEARHTKRIFLPIGDSGFVYALTGSNKGTNRRGMEYLVEITSPLRYFEQCIHTGNRIPSEGTMTIKVQERNEIRVDFGDDTCDKEVSISVGDRTKTITLPRS